MSETTTIPQLESGGEADPRRIVELRLPASPAAPALSRRLVSAAADRAPSLRLIDLALLTSELVSVRVDAGEDIRIALADLGRHVRITVDSADGARVAVDELTRPILDRLASRWQEVPDATWFEIEWLAARSLAGLDDVELFDLRPDNAARSELFERYAGFSIALARRFTRSAVAFDDLEQVAAMALVKAIDRFDPAVGTKFTTYAGETIKGELKHHMRDSAWSVRVPRGLKEATLELRRAEDELRQRLGRQPTNDEVAEAVDLDGSDIDEARGAAQAFTASSLDAPLDADGEGLSLASVLGVDDEALERVEAWHAVEGAMARLPERERRVLYLRFFEDMSQTEIAGQVGVSQMHVSRLLARAIADIRSSIGVSTDTES